MSKEVFVWKCNKKEPCGFRVEDTENSVSFVFSPNEEVKRKYRKYLKGIEELHRHIYELHHKTYGSIEKR